MHHTQTIARSKFAATILIALCLLTWVQVSADPVETDFENFSTGDIHNQYGWIHPGGNVAGTHHDHYVVDLSDEGLDEQYPSFGDRSLRISNGIITSNYYHHTAAPAVANEAGETTSTGLPNNGNRQPYYEAEWDFASFTPGTPQPLLSVLASPVIHNGFGRMAWIGMYDTPNGLEVRVNDYTVEDEWTQYIVAENLSNTAPHRIRMSIAFQENTPAQGPDLDAISNDVVCVWVNDVLVHQGTSWENYFRNTSVEYPYYDGYAPVVNTILFHTPGTTSPNPAVGNTGKGFLIDNYSAYSGPIPAGMENDCTPGDNDDDDSKSPAPAATPEEPPVPVFTFDSSEVGTQTGGAITSSGNDNVMATPLVVNGEGNFAAVGDPNLISQGVVQAVDVFSYLPGGVLATVFDPPLTVCLQGSGTVYFRPTSDQTGTFIPAPAFAVNGSLCVTLSQPGLLVLVGTPSSVPLAASAPPSNGPSTPLTDCQVTTEYILRLRAEPTTSSNVLDRLPMGTTVDTSETVNGWYRVVFGDQQGWVSGAFVNTTGNCG